MRIDLTSIVEPTGDLLDVEIVERKGLGHPDTLCDHLTEELGIALSKYYLSQFGRVLHYNVDKALLWGGLARPAFGGGQVLKPMELFLSGRAVTSIGGTEIPLQGLAEQVTEQWLSTHLPLIDPRKHFKLHCLVRPGSADLADLFERRQEGDGFPANDTSCGVGFAPLSRLERIVYAVEEELGALASTEPVIGRDIKIMGIRQGSRIRLTVACALVDRFISNVDDYQDKKRYLAEQASRVAAAHGMRVSVDVNAADRPQSGSIYMTVTGTSAENGDDGQAGRGNRVNGLITPFRPMTMESVAGKNAVTHVGKLYNLAAGLIADRAVNELPGVLEAYCLLVSTIGRPIIEPQLTSVRVRRSSSASTEELSTPLRRIVEEELAQLTRAGAAIAAGHLRTGRWPLRVPPGSGH